MIESVAEKTMEGAAVGSKTARACDICLRKRARWYCAADDAFLCQLCDDSVHSANPLARRHHRLRLKTASLKRRPSSACQLPTWHRDPTRKPRTPRHRKQQQLLHPVVPELDTSTSMDEDEEQLLYRVPVYEYDEYITPQGFPGPSEFDMAEFAADVEALLGKGLDGDHSCGIEELGLLINSPRTDTQAQAQRRGGMVKVEEEEIGEPFELTFDYDSPFAYCEDGDVKAPLEETCQLQGNGTEKKEWKMLLKLDYDAISTAWGSQRSPWINGNRPSDINPAHDSSHLTPTGGCGTELKAYGEVGEAGIRGGDGGREARVSRYREKRRTRLFSKKIRYEVRKLNAEKRPRMKGRFVKRSSFPLLSNYK